MQISPVYSAVRSYFLPHVILCFTFFVSGWVGLGARASDSATKVEKHFSFNDQPNGHWIGPDFWANRLQDWQVSNGRIVVSQNALPRPLRTVHLLTYRLGRDPQAFEIKIDLGQLKQTKEDGSGNVSGYAGVLVGVGKGEMNADAASIVQWAGNGAGIFVGLNPHGQVLIHDFEQPLPSAEQGKGMPIHHVRLHLQGIPTSEGTRLVLSAHDVESGTLIGRTEATYPNYRLIGNIALAASGGHSTAQYWFDDLVLAGPRISHLPEAKFGPIACIQYTQSRGILKLTAQMLPISDAHAEPVQLQVTAPSPTDGATWRTIAEAHIVRPGYTATFRVEPWDGKAGRDIRLVYQGHHYEGYIQPEPNEKDTVSLAVVNCLHQNSHRVSGNNWGGGQSPPNDWVQGMWFPHVDLVSKLKAHQPDVLFFAGDQIYESNSPTPVDQENLELDYLYKWYLFCRTFGDLTRKIPAVTIPDDHDVYQGNLWGHGGRATTKDHFGGYVRPAWFVKMVERTQTSHLPDPYDPTPIEQGIGVYYTAMTYGGVGFAIIEDRKFKSGSHDPATGKPVDVESDELQLLGKRQLAFLNDWAGDWTGQQIKAVLSQTVFAMPHTHTGANLRYITRDDDANGYPSGGRDRAVDAIRKAFAVHICGDQHLATLLKHGIDEYGDAFWSFCGPSAANFWPRAWAPKHHGPFEPPQSPEDYLGDFLDGWGNKVTMVAVANPGGEPSGHEPSDLYDKATGYGIVRFHKPRLQVTFECWPRYADPTDDTQQYPGWPRTIDLKDNYNPLPAAYLPQMVIHGVNHPVIRVTNADTNELVYARRFIGPYLTPPVFSAGRYRIEVGEPGTAMWRQIDDLEAVPDLNEAVSHRIVIDFGEPSP